MAIMDVERLFRQFTIAEIKDVEKKIKTDIEKKKEDLRQMVGRRYQDIIEAADSISDMKNSSEKILNSLRCVQKGLAPLEDLQCQTKTSRYRTNISKFNSCQDSTLIRSKLLNDLPGLIWECLDSKLYLDAAWLYNLAYYVYRSLGVQNNANFDRNNVELSWKIICDQLGEIDMAIKQALNRADSPEYGVELDALCAVTVLKNLSINDALAVFLSGKEKALESVFEDTELSGRLQICRLVQYFQSTILTLAKLLALGSSTDGPSSKSLGARTRELNDGVFQTEIFADYLKMQSARTFTVLTRETKES